MNLIDLQFENATQVLLKFLIFSGCCLLLWYLLFLILSKVTYLKSTIKRDITVLYTMLWSLVGVIFVFNVLFFILIRHAGIENLNWHLFMTYLGLMHLILLYLLLGGSFYLIVFTFRKKIKNL